MNNLSELLGVAILSPITPSIGALLSIFLVLFVIVYKGKGIVPAPSKIAKWKIQEGDILPLNISIANPKFISKGYESAFLLQIFFPTDRLRVKNKIKREFKEQGEILERLFQVSFELGQIIEVTLTSSEFIFNKPVIKVVTNSITKIIFLGKPESNCKLGAHKILIAITDVKKQIEIDSFTINVNVVDYSFDHIPRPLLSKTSAIFLGIGSFVMFTLTFLAQIDKTIGLTSGAAAGALATMVYANFYNLYQRVRTNTP